jgi:hypothetical protein
MSDDVLMVHTPFADVASLAQGYMNRADGERLLLPLPVEVAPGAGVRFVVALSDGTPAFAGAGICGQCSDQGETVPPEQRYETLLDQLQFDERSQPVYDYLVAVRAAAYAEAQPEQAQAEEDVGEVVDAEDVYAADEAAQPLEQGEQGEVYVSADDAAYAPPEEAEEAEEPTAFVDAQPIPVVDEGEAAHGVAVEEVQEGLEQGLEQAPETAQPSEDAAQLQPGAAADEPVFEPAEGHYDPQSPEMAAGSDAPQVDQTYAEASYVQAEGWAEADGEAVAVHAEGVAVEMEPAMEQPAADLQLDATAAAQPQPPQAPGGPPSFVPPQIPTGILTRPALGVHWAPAVPRRPTPRPSTGLFQYNGSGLPAPAGPPRPDLDPSMWVAPAPRPGEGEHAGASASQPAPSQPAEAHEATAAFDEYADEYADADSEQPMQAAAAADADRAQPDEADPPGDAGADPEIELGAEGDEFGDVSTGPAEEAYESDDDGFGEVSVDDGIDVEDDSREQDEYSADVAPETGHDEDEERA